MKITVDVETAKRLFDRYDRDYYSIEGLAALIAYYDEIDENTELERRTTVLHISNGNYIVFEF